MNLTVTQNVTTLDLTVTHSGSSVSVQPVVNISGSGGGGGATLEKAITQASHGLIVGNAIKHNGTIWVKAQADSTTNSGTLGVVTEVTDVDNFIYTYGGILTVGTYTNGTPYFLSPSVAGAIITEPTYVVGEVREFIGTGTPDGLLLEIDLGDEVTEAVVISGTNTGDQVGDGVTITGAGTVGDPFVSAGGGGTEYQIYQNYFMIDIVTIGQWHTSSVASTVNINEWTTAIGIDDTSTATSYAAGSMRNAKSLGFAIGNQTVQDLYVWCHIPTDMDKWTKITILKVSYAASNTYNYITELYRGDVAFANSPYVAKIQIPATSFAETAISDGDVIYMFVGGTTNNNIIPCEVRLKCSIN